MRPPTLAFTIARDVRPNPRTTLEPRSYRPTPCRTIGPLLLQTWLSWSLHSDFLNERVLPISEWTDFMFADLGFISAADAPCEQPQRSFGYASFDSLPTTTLQNLGPLPTLGHCFDMVLSYDNPRVNCGNHYGDPQVHSCEDGVPVALAYAKWHSATSDAGAVHLRWEKAVRTRSMKKIDKTISKIGSPYRKDKARLQAASATKDEGKTTRLSIRSGLRSQSLRK
jgi:hypothetical protein